MVTNLDKARAICKKMNVKYFCDTWVSGKRSLKPYDIQGRYVSKRIAKKYKCGECGRIINSVMWEENYKQPTQKEYNKIKRELHIKLSKLATKVIKHRANRSGYYNLKYNEKYDKENHRYEWTYYRYLFY